jgi:type II secretory pathway component GspD/PulD (secretin)
MISFLGTFHAVSARVEMPVGQSQSTSATPGKTQQSQPANVSDTTSKSTPAAATNASNTPSSPPIKADLKKAKQANKQGLRAEEQGDWEAAYEAYSDAVNWAPNDSDYFSRREIAKSHVVQMKVDLAERHAISGEIPAALHTLREARELDPTNKVIRDRLTELAALDPSQAKQILSGPEPAREVHLEHSPGKQDFQLRGDTQHAYEEIARRFGVDVAFDVDLRSRPVRLDANDLDFATVMRLLGEETHTFWRPLTKHLFFVSDDTTQKRKEYDVSIVRTVLFSATETPEQMTEISHLVRDVAGITRIQLDTRSRTLTMRASPQAIAVASGIIEDLDQSVGELVLEIEILEMDRNYAEQLGILPPQSAKVLSIPSNAVAEAESGLPGLVAVLTQIFGGSALGGLSPTQLAGFLSSGQVNAGSLIPPVVAFGGGASTFLATVPGAAASFSEMLSLVRQGRRILLRVEDNQPATFFVGERFPVDLAQFSASLQTGTTTPAGTSIPGVIGSNFPITNLATGNAPDFVTTADVNADNFQDLIVANFTDNTLFTFLGNGDGTFQNAISTPTGVGPVSIATGTFNSKNNTNVGLAVANQTDDTVSILLGNGDGTFTAAPGSPIKTGKHPTSVVSATLTNSGQLDLIVANQQDNTVSIFRGNGDGTFAAPVNLATGNAPTGLAVADFNNDGKLDLAVTNQTDNSVSVYLGNGDGTFNNPLSFPTGQAPVYVAAADFNGDNILDLAVANNGAGTATLSGNSVSILLGVGNGTFGATNSFPAGNGPTSIAIADYNVDGRPDLAVTAQTDNAVSLLLGIGDGTFAPFFEFPVETNPVSLATAIFTNSGQPDLAVANNGSNTVSVIINSSAFASANEASTGTQFPNAEYIDVGVKVKATPRIHQNDEVTLQLELDLTSLTGTILNNIPVVSNEVVHQTVRVKTDQTAALAGFRSPQYMRGLNGTPATGGLSGIGLLGTTEDVQNQDTEVLILVTPRMVALAPRKDHLIYAGRGALEGPGAQGPTRQERQGEPLPQVPQPQPQPQPQQRPPSEPTTQPQQPPPQPVPQQQPQPQ